MNIRILMFLLPISFAYLTNAQSSAPDISMEELKQKSEELSKRIEEGKKRTDNLRKAINSTHKALAKKQQDEAMKVWMEQNKENLNSFAAKMEENRKKQRRSNWIRGAGLAALVVVGIVSFIRRKRN
jgi:septal ring factor EnvC (AmiA/AmiB activator)